MRALTIALMLLGAAGCASTKNQSRIDEPAPGERRMMLGNFSVSLTVKDLNASREFYEKLGFRAIGGDAAKNWLIVQSGAATIGLFQGMFEKNMLTFNPGWDAAAKTLAEFDDVREIQRALKQHGLTLIASADEASTGPAYIMLADPDGNPILIDQHVAKPVKQAGGS